MREKVTIGIDVGSSEVVAIVGHRSEGEIHPNIIGVGVQENSGLRKGVVTDVEETMSSVAAALDKAERMAGVPIEGAYISINGEHIQSSNTKGLVSVAHSEIGSDDVARAIESAQTVALPANREIIHVLPRTFIVDGQDQIRDPIGMFGTRLEVDAHIVTGSTPFIRNLQKTVEQAGVSIANFVLAPLAASKAVLTKKQKELGVAVIDIGSDTTGLTVFDEGDLCHSVVMPIGARHLTSDIAIGLRTSLEVAEKVKIEYGMASAVMLSDKDTIDLSRFDKAEDQVISRRYVAEIIEARLMELFMMVKTELRKVGKDGMLPAGAVLVGGGAKLPGIVDFAKDHLGLPAQIGFPIELRGVVDHLDDPRFVTAIGLVMWGMDDDHNSSIYAAEPSFGGVFSRLKSWFK
ncbi:MAG: cell division protein FtsA [Patescibacteria group bacterium]|nr:cell division protein FtsA [Patescibacteria group bacterium]